MIAVKQLSGSGVAVSEIGIEDIAVNEGNSSRNLGRALI
jgi:hypothetical protein